MECGAVEQRLNVGLAFEFRPILRHPSARMILQRPLSCGTPVAQCVHQLPKESASMKSLSAPLQAHLDEGTTTLAWCWRITRADGLVLGFTDHDWALAFLGTSFEPDSGLIASEVRSGSDLSVDAQDAEGVLMSGRITETDIIDGRWDNATVEAWRVNWADTSQRVLMRQGNVGQIRRGRMAFVAEVRSMAHALGQTVGRTFQAGCDAALGDTRCGVNQETAGLKGTGAVATLLRDRAFLASGLTGFADSLFTFGTVEWTSGPNAGRRTEIMIHEKAGSDVTITLLGEPVRAIAAGHTFTIRAGCNKRIDTCSAKFANAVNFRGFPTIPGQDSVLRYAVRDGSNQGAVL